MTEESLLSHLARRIRRNGPLTFAGFMAEALYHPRHGRYSLPSPPMGPEGDYITSPEVDPAFGRLLARAFAEMASRLPGGPFSIVEPGPGKGTLCRDVLLALEDEAPELAARTAYHLVEESAALRRQQEALLGAAGLSERVRWSTWSALRRRSPIHGCLVANEFLDALPVHLVEMTEGRLREIHVGLDGGGGLIEIAREPSTPELGATFEDLGVTLAEGQRAEVNLLARRFVSEAAGLLRRGYAVVIDYGHEAADLYSDRHFAGTLVGYRRHQLVVDPLAEPGGHDLTSHVDFTSISRAALAAGWESFAMTTQRKMLIALGLAEMIAALAIDASPDGAGERVRRRFALHSLMSPTGMGETFKVMILARGAELDGLACLRDRILDRDAAIRRGGAG
ncbi:MAG: SAM-dependent methyltransferase [Acidobacteria bacterium]|nr:SAM-dependent methyltransferase [Acidobacteriota bacterium]